MKRCITLVLLLGLNFSAGAAESTRAKPRVIVLTDIENEPDDTQSLVRFLTYCNHWDVEALVATTSMISRRGWTGRSNRMQKPTIRRWPSSTIPAG